METEEYKKQEIKKYLMSRKNLNENINEKGVKIDDAFIKKHKLISYQDLKRKLGLK